MKLLKLGIESPLHHYYVMNKDEVIGEFDMDDMDLVCHVYNARLPKWIARDIKIWLNTRTPPKHRKNMKELLDICGINSLRGLIDFSKCLSLNDTFWVTQNTSIKWEDINLYDNEFNEVISRIAFDGGMHGAVMKSCSPEFATDGQLGKCWHREGSEIYLYKTGSDKVFSNMGNEPLSEVLSSQVLDALSYDHVKYELKNFRGKVTSRCKCFTNEKCGFLPLYMWLGDSSLELIIEQCDQKRVLTGLLQTLVFDYLSVNTDRHAGNMGVLFDTETYNIIDFAPIFDNGMAMCFDWGGTQDINLYVEDPLRKPALYDNFEQGIQFADVYGFNFNSIRSLFDFKFDLTQIGNFEKQRVDKIQHWLNERARNLMSEV